MKKHKLVLLDLGGVLVKLADPLFPPAWSTPSKEFSLTTWFQSPMAQKFETGEIGPSEFLGNLKQDLQLSESIDEISDKFRGWLQGLYPGCDELLIKLRQSHQVAVLSNTNEIHEDILLSDYDLTTKVDRLFLSHRMGLAKPNSQAFLNVLNELKVAAQDVIFFDDNQANLAAARKLGICAHLATGPQTISDYFFNQPEDRNN